MTTPDHILPPPVRDTGPLETMARALWDYDADFGPFKNDPSVEPPGYYLEGAMRLAAALDRAGLDIVPREPTEAMTAIGGSVLDCADSIDATEIYRAMIAAAPLYTKEGE